MDRVRHTDELVSALTDGELSGDAFEKAIQLIGASDKARGSWYAYHLVGDVLRSGEQAASPLTAGFLANLRDRLAHESITTAQTSPHELSASFLTAEHNSRKIFDVEAANEASFRWKLMAGVASLAAICTVAWSLMVLQSGKPTPAELAQSTQSPVKTKVAGGTGEPLVMVRDQRLDELLAAHRQAGGASALQMPSGFLRNATFEGPAR